MKKLLIICMLFSLQALGQAQTVAIDKEKIFDLYQNQRYAEAGEYLKTSYGSETTDLKALTQIGYCFLMAGNNVEAEKYYAKADAIQPGNLPILFSLASINTRRGNTEKAKLYYGNIVKLDSNNFIVYKLLANLYLSDKDSLKMVYLLKANKLVPTDGDVAADLAAVHSVYQNYDRAYEVLNVAIKADPENLVLQRTKLPIANLLKKYDEVIASGESLLKDNKDASVIKDLAKAYYYTKKYDKAVTLFRQLEEMLMQNENTLYVTTLCYRNLKNYKMATLYAKKTIDEAISPNTSSYYALLGLAYEEDEKFTLADAAYKKGLQFNSNPNLYYRLATLHDTKFKRSKSAMNYYQLYLKSKPNPKNDAEEIKFVQARIEQMALLTK
ncbi:hypothetical protein EA772_11390 [Pedobacter sp. G11]|uniref:tetratricopeptide repeat protein n=1 Tax=Pedobacter sp. G11 TaxID=2482728 RepID=UPI000F5DECA0|nr:hypothetical protein [Pedobacter sp. G11]AZI25917.1 hypothetical protein EA772_11390 [Pedobacter sp. G11]